VLPGAQAVVFTANTIIGDFDHATIEIQSLRTKKRKTLVRGGYYGRYAASGHLLYVRNGTVYARHLYVERQELDGPEPPVIPNVTPASSGYAFFDISLNGTLIYAEGEQATRRLTWLTTGASEPLRARAAQYGQFPLRFS
jgi:serine/threonine-protein kinase